MSSINNKNIPKSYKHILAAVFLLATLILIGFLFFEKVIAENRINESRKNLLPHEYYVFYQKHYKYVNHLRELHLDRLQSGVYEEPKSLMYSTIGMGEKKILMQGDSWVEQFIHSPFSKQRLISYAKNNNATFIVGGISSYSPSLMTAQLNRLRSYFNFSNIDYVVAYIDQTDIGDELCRYKLQRRLSYTDLEIQPFDSSMYSEVYSTNDLLEDVSIYFGDQSNTAKLFSLAKNQVGRHLRKKISRQCGWGKIISPLEYGITSEEKSYFIDVLTEYISVVFNGLGVKKLIFVTFPHRGHLDGIFKLDVSSLIEDAIKLSVDKNRIINFRPSIDAIPKIKKQDLFLQNDPGSHLTNEAHGSVFTELLLMKLKNN